MYLVRRYARSFDRSAKGRILRQTLCDYAFSDEGKARDWYETLARRLNDTFDDAVHRRWHDQLRIGGKHLWDDKAYCVDVIAVDDETGARTTTASMAYTAADYAANRGFGAAERAWYED